MWKTKENPTISRDSRESRDYRDSCSENTPFVVTPFSGPESKDDIRPS